MISTMDCDRKRYPMELSEYKVLQKKDLQGKKYTELRIGKQRKKGFKQDSIYLKPMAFSLLDGFIWDKYREYSPTTTNAISSREWKRIFSEFDAFIATLEDTTSLSDIKRILGLRSRNDLPENIDVDEFKKVVIEMFQAVETWITDHMSEEGYITICV